MKFLGVVQLSPQRIRSLVRLSGRGSPDTRRRGERLPVSSEAGNSPESQPPSLALLLLDSGHKLGSAAVAMTMKRQGQVSQTPSPLPVKESELWVRACSIQASFPASISQVPSRKGTRYHGDGPEETKIGNLMSKPRELVLHLKCSSHMQQDHPPGLVYIPLIE